MVVDQVEGEQEDPVMKIKKKKKKKRMKRESQ